MGIFGIVVTYRDRKSMSDAINPELYTQMLTKPHCLIIVDETYVKADFRQLPGLLFFTAQLKFDFPEEFSATYGCLQYNTKQGYYHPHPYYSTARFKNMHLTKNNVTKMRMGVLARNDGHIRLSPIEYPYDNTKINEIVLSGWGNTAIEIRRYTCKDHKTHTDIHIFKHIASNGLLSEFIPMMFTMEIDRRGKVKLIKDGDVFPLVEFQDPKIAFNYIGFCNWDVPAIYFFDCPFEVDRRNCIQTF
ncbi:uncharacterized protein LOC135707970 [Ochlerotatus camptorhynchus]|uniref:uncharacterized protein LOC135707970 n=1 Tax=Ochlerotatus camptorhynchus TaxID=644619 RepID=UPI0031D826E0